MRANRGDQEDLTAAARRHCREAYDVRFVVRRGNVRRTAPREGGGARRAAENSETVFGFEWRGNGVAASGSRRDYRAMPNRISDEQRAWELTCSRALTTDVIWKLDAYRAALFLLHVSRGDCQVVRAARPDDTTPPQLTSAAASASAHLSEGYSRSTRADRLRFLGYSLGSARECVSWYEATRGVLPDETIEERLMLVMRVRSLLLGLIRSLRGDGGGPSDFER